LAVPRHSMCRKTPEATRRVISREKEPKKKKKDVNFIVRSAG
jgi:hypothetical protein